MRVSIGFHVRKSRGARLGANTTNVREIEDGERHHTELLDSIERVPISYIPRGFLKDLGSLNRSLACAFL